MDITNILVSIIYVSKLTFIILGIILIHLKYTGSKNKFLEIIKKSDSVAQDGKGKLVKIPMSSTSIGCDKYLVYDEADEMANSKGSFRGIDYVNVNDDIVGYSYHKKAFQVLSYYVDKHIYVMYFCLDTGQ